MLDDDEDAEEDCAAAGSVAEGDGGGAGGSVVDQLSRTDGRLLTRCCFCCLCWPPVQLSAISPDQPEIHLSPSFSFSHSSSHSPKASRSITSLARSQSDAQHRPVEVDNYSLSSLFWSRYGKGGRQDGRSDLGMILSQCLNLKTLRSRKL